MQVKKLQDEKPQSHSEGGTEQPSLGHCAKRKGRHFESRREGGVYRNKNNTGTLWGDQERRWEGRRGY